MKFRLGRAAVGQGRIAIAKSEKPTTATAPWNFVAPCHLNRNGGICNGARQTPDRHQHPPERLQWSRLIRAVLLVVLPLGRSMTNSGAQTMEYIHVGDYALARPNLRRDG